ncbi:MAG: DUF2232 domain-containing protein [Acidimicrobiales bacterium]|jgi:energy-coupling factor transport system ATP-binding protein
MGDGAPSHSIKTAEAPPRGLKGALRPAELAEAVVFADLGLVLEVLGWYVPVLGTVFQALAVVPFAALAGRRRARASVVAILAAGAVAFLVGGVGIVVETAVAGALGMAIGTAYRRRWTPATAVLVATATAGVPIAGISVAAAGVSPGLRRLGFAQLEIIWRDLRALLKLVGLKSLVSWGNTALAWVIDHWWMTVPVFELVTVVLAAALCAHYLWPLLARIERDSPVPVVTSPGPGTRSAVVPPFPAGLADPGWSPVPVELDRVSFQYPGSATWAVEEVSMRIGPGTLLAVVGPNGSGKSTLVRLIAGRLSPTRGEVRRAGDPGLGLPGGTSMVFQRPESQVLGVRARDDVAWGLPARPVVDVKGLLARVGLAGFAERETAGLSGGELQRLAIAACLARRPRLLISDEATAMIDQPGRVAVVTLLESLAAAGITIVHVTHRESEAAHADAAIKLLDGRLAAPNLKPADEEEGSQAEALTDKGNDFVTSTLRSLSYWERPAERLLLRVRELGYVYAKGTPWARRALETVDLDLRRGEGIVITGGNGSGKSTLAWVLAGLLAPSEGEVLLDGEPVIAGTGAVGISFQHARLQLIRPTVMADVAYGADEERAAAALRSVALEPEEIGPRRVDELSGGEQRCVALAGLLACDPVLLVLDEPYAGLDDEARAALAAILARLRHEREVATVVVSHDLDNTELLGDRLIALEAGRIVGERALRGGT